MSETTRREFLHTALAGLAMGSSVVAAQQPGPAGLPTRPLGSTGERITIVGLGGWHIGALQERREAVAIMHEAIDLGMTFFDNCWDYHEGRSEQWMGQALATDGRRDKVFLMTKVCGRSYRTAKQHLDDSLRRLRTDRIDLWQFHGMKWDDDAQLIFAEDGALKAALEARKAGKIRFIGFTGHKAPQFHRAMLDQSFAWDAAQMPINVVDAHYQSFQKQVLPICAERKIGVIGMKALASQQGRIVTELGIPAETCRRFSLSLPISALVCGITSKENLRQDVAMARNFKPMTEAELTQLLAKVREPGSDGRIEAYKTDNYGCDWHHRQQPS